MRLFLDGEIDQRTCVARRFRDLCQLHTADMGGAAMLSEAQAQLVRRVAMIEVQLEVLEGRMVAGDDKVDLEEFARVSSHLRRLYETLGVRRVAKDVTPSLGQIIAAHADAPAPATKPAPKKPVNGATRASNMVEGTILAAHPLSPISEPRAGPARGRAPLDFGTAPGTEGTESHMPGTEGTAPANHIENPIAALDADHVTREAAQ